MILTVDLTDEQEAVLTVLAQLSGREASDVLRGRIRTFLDDAAGDDLVTSARRARLTLIHGVVPLFEMGST